MNRSNESYEVVVTQEAGVVRCDFERAKRYLAEKLEEYNGMTFTEDTKKAAKTTVAELRKEKESFSKRVKQAKEEYMQPFKVFESQAKELLEMYDKPIAYIGSQVAEFERKRIAEKQTLIKQIYDECIGEMSDEIPLSSIFNAKWENATMAEKAIREEMILRKCDIKSIKEMGSDAEKEAIRIYFNTFNLSESVKYIGKYEAQKREILKKEQERIKQDEEARIRKEERERLEAERKAQEEKEAFIRQAEEEKQLAVEIAKEKAAQEVIESLIAGQEGESNLYEYRLSLTESQKEKLEMYLNSVGISWEMI